jgi:hypothetical protein
LPLLGETQVDRVGHRRDIAFFLHASSCEFHILDQCYSKRRAIDLFSLCTRALADRLRVGIQGSVRNAVIDLQPGTLDGRPGAPDASRCSSESMSTYGSRRPAVSRAFNRRAFLQSVLIERR